MSLNTVLSIINNVRDMQGSERESRRQLLRSIAEELMMFMFDNPQLFKLNDAAFELNKTNLEEFKKHINIALAPPQLHGVLHHLDKLMIKHGYKVIRFNTSRTKTYRLYVELRNNNQ
jgi:hypothetical protein